MTSPIQFGFSADPRALTDLRAMPPEIRDLSLLNLQDLVTGDQRGGRLGRRAMTDLSGYRHLMIDPDARWRLVYQERPSPPRSPRAREIHLVAAGRRDGHRVYNVAAFRLGQLHLGGRPHVPLLAPAAAHRPGLR